MSHPADSSSVDPRLLHDLLLNTSSSSSKQASWETISAADAPLIRQALVRAQTMRILNSDAGDAYLQGIIDAINLRR